MKPDLKYNNYCVKCQAFIKIGTQDLEELNFFVKTWEEKHSHAQH